MIGRPRVHHRLTDSTNERAKLLAREGAPHGTLVTAAEQEAGRGRQGRAWTAPPGTAVLMSLLVRDLGPGNALLPLATAVAVCEASEALAPVECRIKWPNDVWVGERKLSGILIEGRPQEGWAVIGIGLNVRTESDEFPDELREIATSLRAEAGDDAPTVEAALGGLLAALERRLADEPDETLALWGERDVLRGRTVRWRDGEGTAAGVDRTGALRVETAHGEVSLDAGEVHLLR
jgi:BirA family transcriptional regulator, biotin operon repressor / biotin---[acetyl-CoA-carboxylase] ligase